MPKLQWVKGPLGWSAFRDDVRYAITRYPAWRGRRQGWAYVPQVDGHALGSPAPAFPSLAAAKRAAEVAGFRKDAETHA